MNGWSPQHHRGKIQSTVLLSICRAKEFVVQSTLTRCIICTHVLIFAPYRECTYTFLTQHVTFQVANQIINPVRWVSTAAPTCHFHSPYTNIDQKQPIHLLLLFENCFVKSLVQTWFQSCAPAITNFLAFFLCTRFDQHEATIVI